ncbi:MSCRAMM family protein [Pilimelia anulata]|nr:carboxypeptidase-like regulatory domain-containing protein [Pilimelia anulata]
MRRFTHWRLMLAGLLALLAVVAGPVGSAVAAADPGTLAVTLLDTDGSPLRLAEVRVFDEQGRTPLFEGNTDDAGRIAFADVDPGKYTVFCRIEGLKMWAESTELLERATVYEVRAGATTEVRPRLLPHARIAGVLTDADGGVSWGEMTAHPVGRFGARVTEVTDGDGRAAVRVAPGTYRVEFAADGISQWVPGRPSAEGATELTVAAGDRITLTESLPETGRVHGVITDAAGEPVLGATVRLHVGEFEAHRERTNRRGEFTLARVRAGAYTVSVLSPRGSMQWLPGTGDPAGAKPITVGRDADVEVNEKLLPTGAIEGVLSGKDGQPTSHGWVFAKPVPDNGSEVILSATPDRQGRYRMDGLAAGRYRIGFEIDGRRQYLGGKGSAPNSEPITLAGGEVRKLDERAATGQRVTLTANDEETGTPLTVFCAVLIGPDAERLPDSDAGKYPRGCTDSGSLVLPDVLPGRYEATVRTPNGSGHLPTTDRVAVPADGPAEAGFLLDRGGSVTVQVGARPTDSRRRPRPRARPVGDVTVHLVPTRPGLPALDPASTDAGGAATFAAVPKGTYRMFVEPRGNGLGRQWVGAAGGVGREAEAAPIVVKSGKPTAAPPVLLDPAGLITGLVTSGPSGRPMMAEVSWLAPRAGLDPPAAITDVGGRFLAGGFGPYDWPLRFTTGAFPSQWSGRAVTAAEAQTVRVLAKQTVALDASLTRGVDLTGTIGGQWRAGTVAVLGPDGAELAEAEVDQLTRRYRLPVLAGRTVRLRYEFSTIAGPRRGWYDNGEVYDAAKDIHVPAGSTGAVVDFALAPVQRGTPRRR